MAKGLFTQGMCVLLRSPVSAEAVIDALDGFTLVGRHENDGDEDVSVTLVFDYRPEVNGHLLVTLSGATWPDELGDPDEIPERFIAWSLGQYGPLAFPGCLQRAGEQSWAWEDAASQVDRHRGHIRFLVSYVIGPHGTDDPVRPDETSDPETKSEGDGDADIDPNDPSLMPADYNPIDELRYTTKAVESVLQLPEALCYFNPAGEVLRDGDGLRRGLNHAWSHELVPIDMWTNVRLFRADETWSLMDTVGNGQFDTPDVEAVFSSKRFEPSEVEGFLRSASLYMLTGDDPVEDGDTADGPGEISWRAIICADGLSDPPRQTVRWIPEDGDDPPERFLDPGDDRSEDDDEDTQVGGDDEPGDEAEEFIDNAFDEELDEIFGDDDPRTGESETDDDTNAF